MKVDSVLKFNYCNNYRRPINKTNNISINNKSFMIPVSFRSSYTQEWEPAQIIKKVIGEAGKEVYFEILNGTKDSKITYDPLEKQIKNIKPEYSEELIKAYRNIIDL